MTIGAASTVIGPALAGLLIAWHGAVLVIALDAVTFVVVAATFHFFADPEAETLDPRPEHNAAEPPTSGKVSVIRGNPTLMGLLALSFGFFFLFGPVYVALPLHVATDLHGSATLLAAFYTAFGIGALLGAALTGYLKRWPLWPSTIGIVVGFGSAMLLVGLDVPTPVALVSFALAGLLWPPYASMSTALFQHSTTSRLLHQLLAANSSVRVLSVPLGTALGGPLGCRSPRGPSGRQPQLGSPGAQLLRYQRRSDAHEDPLGVVGISAPCTADSTTRYVRVRRRGRAGGRRCL